MPKFNRKNPGLKSCVKIKFGSQKEFAKAINDHASRVSRILNGIEVPGKKTMEKWGKVLNVSPEILFRLTKKDSRNSKANFRRPSDTFRKDNVKAKTVFNNIARKIQDKIESDFKSEVSKCQNEK